MHKFCKVQTHQTRIFNLQTTWQRWLLTGNDDTWTAPICLVTRIATLRWASCGPGTGLQAHPLKSQCRFGKKNSLTNYTKTTKNISAKLHLPLLDTLHQKQNQKLNWNNYISMVLRARFSNKDCLQKNKQPKWRLLWSQDPWDHIS